MKVLYFTGTGNSLYAAKKIGGESYSISQACKEGMFDLEDDAVGFVFPCYALGTPRLVRRFLEKVHIKADYIFAVMTYGGEPGAGVLQFCDFAKGSGIHIDYTNEVKMVDNMKVVDNYDEEIIKDDSIETKRALDRIASDISNRVRRHVAKSAEQLKMTQMAYPTLDKQLDHSDETYLIKDGCTGCRTCEKACPVGNITVIEGPVFDHRCEACHACLHVCPEHIIVFPEYKGDHRYINSHIKKKELIKANNVK